MSAGEGRGAAEGVLSAAEFGELTELRRRAYGPSPDIADDPVAQRRLMELEAAMHHGRSAGGGEESTAHLGTDETAGGAATALRDDEVAAASSPDTRSEVPAPAARGPLWLRPRTWLVAGGALFVCGFLVVGIPPLLPGSPRETLGLRAETPTEELIELDGSAALGYLGIDRDDVRLHEEFRDLNIWSAPSDQGTTCLLISTRAQSVWAYGCAPAGTDPIVDVNKYTHELIHRDSEDPWVDLPYASLLRFVLRGDTVGVWMHPAPDLPGVEAPQG